VCVGNFTSGIFVTGNGEIIGESENIRAGGSISTVTPASGSIRAGAINLNFGESLRGVGGSYSGLLFVLFFFSCFSIFKTRKMRTVRFPCVEVAFDDVCSALLNCFLAF